MPVSADRAARPRPADPQEKPDFSTWEGEIQRETDSPAEGDSVDPRQIPSLFQHDTKAGSAPTHFGTHPEGPVSGARWRTTADEDTTTSNNLLGSGHPLNGC